MANRITTFGHTATGAATSVFKPLGGSTFNVWIYGDGVGTVKLEKSFDGTNWFDLSRDAAGVLASFDKATGQEMCLQAFEPEDAVAYRSNVTSFTSGTVTVRMSQ